MKSRFYDELPEDCLKWLTPKNQNFGRCWNASASPSGAMQSGAAYAGSTGAEGIFWSQIARRDNSAHGLRVGMQVFHTKFGEGKVLTLEGSGDDARAQINFPRHGIKWLALSVAKLTPI